MPAAFARPLVTTAFALLAWGGPWSFGASGPARAQEAACIVCPRPLSGQVRVLSLEDERWRLHADDPMPAFCLYCEHPLAPRSPYGDPVRSADGRVVCAACRRAAVTDPVDAQRILNRVRTTMTGWGMAFPWAEIPVRLVPRGSLTGEAPPGTSGEVNGICRVTRQRRFLVGPVRIVEVGIAMTTGLPRLHFERTAAHELTHAWMALNGCPSRQADAFREGACDLAAYFYLQTLDTAEARRARHRMMLADDPVYGAGLKRQLRYAERHRVSGVLAALKTRTDFAPGY